MVANHQIAKGSNWMARELKPKPEYSCECVDEGNQIYKVTKIMPNGEEQDPYTVQIHPSKTITCDCYAGLTGKNCRHKQMVELFIVHNKVGSIATYCFDRKEWR